MVDTQQFNLRWNNHTSNVHQVFLELLSSESLVDVTLSCEGKFLKAHKIILSACSTYFREVFDKHTDNNPLIILNGIKFEDLRSMIQFMYNGEIRVLESRLQGLLAAAETLQVKGLSNVRSKYEKGEITSLAPTQKVTPKSTESKEQNKETPPVHSIKATVALFGPTNTVSRVQSTGSSTIAIATPTTTITGRLQPISANTAARITSKASSKTISIAPRPAATPVPPLAIVTNMPAVSPLSVANNSKNIRPVVPILPRPSPKIVATKISTIPANPTISSAAKTASTLPITFTTPSTSTTSVSSGCIKIGKPGNKVETNKEKSPKTHLLLYSKDDKKPVTEISLVPIKQASPRNADAIVKDDEAEKKTIETPRVRKRRKMSHVVNELASETVFASNGTVLLEPDSAAPKIAERTSLAVRTDLCDSAEIKEILPNENLRVKVLSKQPQESLLIRDSEKKEQKIPRPPNAFMVFANEWRRKVATDNPTESNTKISTRLGIMWKGMSVKSKETYFELAKKADAEHKLKYPGYFYSPKQARIRKNMKQDQNLAKFFLVESKPQNFKELEMIETCMDEEEKKPKKEATYSFESDDDYAYENEAVYENEEEDDVILEYSAEEDEIDVKPDLSLLEASTT